MPPKKSRTPPPPRRPQGPRQRADTGGGERRSRMILYGLAATGIIGLVLVLALFAFAGGGSNSASVEAAMKDAGCTFKTYKEQPRTPHFATTPPAKPFKYNSFPPSSGRHYFQTVTYGFYDQPVDKYSVVHNLEHGAILVYWGNKVPRSEIEKIRTWWQDDARGIVASPLPALGNKIAVVAWTHVAKCTSFDDKAFSKFRDTFQFKGPEQIPPESMDPGAQ